MGKKKHVVNATNTPNITDLITTQRRALDGLQKVVTDHPDIAAALAPIIADVGQVLDQLNRCILFPVIDDSELQAMLESIDVDDLMRELESTMDIEGLLNDLHPAP